jgi:hypothetical protein
VADDVTNRIQEAFTDCQTDFGHDVCVPGQENISVRKRSVVEQQPKKYTAISGQNTRVIARLDASDGPQHPFRDVRAVAECCVDRGAPRPRSGSSCTAVQR